MQAEDAVREGRGGGAGAAALFAGVLLAFATCAGLLVYGSGRGYDLTDEVFYLIWTRDPRAYALTYQPFGYLLHPLFHLVGGDLQLYRLAGFAITAAAGACLGLGLAEEGRVRRGLFALYGATAALVIFFPWIVTPSYNSAANVGALLMIGGVVGALRGEGVAWRIAGAAALAAGLCIAAFAKPPLFAMGLAGVIVLALAVRQARMALAASLVLAGVLISLILPPGELAALVARISASQAEMGMPNRPLALPAKVARDWLIVPLSLSAAALSAGASLAARRARWASWLGYAAVAFSFCYAYRVAVDVMDGDMPDFLGLALVTVAAGYAGVVRPTQPSRRLALFLLIAAPAAVALGTFNNQWGQLNLSMAFPLLALFALAASDPVPWRRSATQAFALAAPVGLLVLAALRPYSLPASIFDQQVPIEAPLARGLVRVDPETADFVRSARGLAANALLIDLSGTGPGVAVVLGARAPVLPWLNPATPRWPDLVWSRLSPPARESASFVVPVWPAFEGSAPARWLAAHKDGYCRTPLPQMPFWGEERTLELWRPCAGAALRSKGHAPR